MRLVTILIVFFLAAPLLAQPDAACGPDDFRIEIPSNQKPWNHLDLNNNPCNFQFAIVTDRTGGHRPGVFLDGVKKLNLLQPEFVMSVGDLIEGYTTDTFVLEREWEEFDGFVDQLDMPFFYVPGNHDITNPVMEQVWKDRYGPTYYHFVYKDVLFLALNSEDQKRGAGRGTISDEQYEWIKATLEANQNVKWTLVFLHQPLWIQEAETLRWQEVEQLFAARKHTVFAGHRHNYTKFERNNAKYFMLATTGGGSSLRGPQMGEFDHVVWVTMTEAGPVIANLLLEGVWDENVATEASKGFIAKILERDLFRIEPFFVEDSGFQSATLDIQVRNDEDIPMEVRLQESFSWDFMGSLDRNTFVVKPNMVEAAQLTVVKRREGPLMGEEKPFLLKAEVSYTLEGDRKITIPFSFHLTPHVKRTFGPAPKPKVIDGDLSDWDALTQRFVPEPEGDLEVDFDLQYDADFLYLAVRVLDDEVLVDTSYSLWQQDGIGFFLNGEPLYKSVMATGGNWFNEALGFRISPATELLPSLHMATENTPEGVIRAARLIEGGYAVEAAIPRAYITDQQGLNWPTLRMNLLVEDADADFREKERYFWQPRWDREGHILGSGVFFRVERP